jgi:hypothetical protein
MHKDSAVEMESCMRYCSGLRGGGSDAADGHACNARGAWTSGDGKGDPN